MKRKSRRNQEMVESVYVNDDTYFDYVDRMRKIAISMFEWENLPSSMDSRFLERSLYLYGTAALLYDKNLGFINTNCTNTGEINIYGLPTEVNCFSYGYNENRKTYNGLMKGINKRTGELETVNKKDEECIYVMNTWDRTPTSASLNLFAYRLYEAQRTCDVNIKAQKTPVVVITDENQRLTFKNVYAQVDGNSPVIFGDKNLDLDKIKALRTDAPYVADKIMDYKTKIWNEFLNFLGINNLYEKRERVNVEETSINNEVINLNLQSFLAPRKQACEQFNEKFGLTGDNKINVRLRSDLYNVIKQAESIVTDYKETEENLIDGGDQNG